MCCCSFVVLVSVCLVVLCSKVSFALRDVKIQVPQAVVRGKDAELECSFDLEREKLYCVKWYRNESEIFRYTPNEPVPVRTFPLKGIKVRGDASRIVLENVSREISGPFSCEVTAEMPSFFTVMQTAELQVVDIPRKDPYITGLKKRYLPKDDVFQANCTSEYSFPATNVTWSINGLQIRGPQVMKRTINYENHFTVISTIRHRLVKRLFPNGRMKLRCSVSLYDVYHKSTEVTLELSERRRKNHHPDWPPTTKAPPPLISEDNYTENEDGDDSPEEYSKIKLWFWSPSAATSTCTSSTTLMLLTSVAWFR